MVNVSVIIPNYNHAAFLEKRIESVVHQSYRDFEIILLDDCSTDNSKLIIEKYRDNQKISHIIYNEKNSGSTFFQWERGMRLAKGKYIWIAESDDFAEYNFLEVLMKPFTIYPELVISHCRSSYVDENNKLIGLTLWADQMDNVKWTKDYVEDGSAEINRFLKYRNTIPNASAVLFKKPPFIEKVLRTDMRFTGDWLFWKNLLKGNSKIAYSHLPLNYFRNHQNTTRSSSSGSSLEKELKRFSEYRHFVPSFLLNPLEIRYRWMLEEWINRTKGYKNLFYTCFPLLHPALAFRYYLFSLKQFLKSFGLR